MHSSSKRYARIILPWLVFLAGLFGTGLAAYFEKLSIEQGEYNRFAVYCNEIRLKIAARLDAHKQTLLGGAALFDASDSVSRQEWRKYVERLRSDEHFNGIQGLGFAQWISSEKLAGHQAQVRAEGFPEYRVRPEGKRDAYTSIVYLEPFNDRNLRAFGFDMYSEPVRRAAMEQARDENRVALSGKVKLVQETEANVQAGTLMYVPVYKRNQSVETVEQRRAALIGWVYSPFRMGDLLNKLVPDFDGGTTSHVHFRVYDGREIQDSNLLYSNSGTSLADNDQSLGKIDIEHDFNGTPWTLHFEKIGGIDYGKMWLILGTGSFTSLLLFLLLRSYVNTQINAAKIAYQLTAQLRESERLFRHLADSAPVLIWLAGNDKGCYYFNKVWLEFTGRTLEQEQGNGWADSVHPDDFQSCLDTYVKAFDRRDSFSMEYRLRRHDGEYRWIIDTGVPRYTEDNVFLGYIGSCIDISERKQIEDKLARAHSELAQFTRIAAHHLQEPVRRLVSFAQRLRAQIPAEQLNEDTRASLYFIEQSAARQHALVRDIQLYLASDQPRSRPSKVDVVDVIDELLEQRAELLRETGARLDYNKCFPVYIDRPRLKDIFSILLDNALQYRHSTLPPHIQIHGEPKAGRVVYRIADNGIGIPEEYRERVFGVFERLQVREDQNSTGIGLAIVRRIVESCGGYVILQETPGGGTTVLFDLPEVSAGAYS